MGVRKVCSWILLKDSVNKVSHVVTIHIIAINATYLTNQLTVYAVCLPQSETPD